MADPSPGDARREIRQARDALHDARVLDGSGGTTTGVVNRLYYAAFHAAQAALYADGRNPSSHGHVRQQFGQHVVLDGDASRDEGRLLGTLYDYRREADYGGGPPDVDVDSLVSDVEAFVDHMDTLVSADASD